MRKTQTWDAPGILAAIKRKGTNLTALATDHGLKPSACRTSLTRAFPAADKVISDFLEVPLSELWPARYRADGSRIDRRTIRYRAQPMPNCETPHRQFAEAR